MKQGGPQSRSSTSEPPFPNAVEQTLPHSQTCIQGPIYVTAPLRPITTYLWLEHWAVYDFEEQYELSMANRKGKEKDETSAQIVKLDAKLKLMKGGQFSISMDFEDLYIHPGGVLQQNFQMSNVEKYDGTTCPRMHLRMYCNAMF